MSTRTCHHVLASGALCGAVPLRHRNYCRFHLQQIGRRLRAARARARHEPVRLKLPLLEDPLAVQVALMQVADAIAYNEIDVPRGRLLLSVLRLASSNLKTARAWDQEPLFVADEDAAATSEWPGFEQEHELPPNFDLSVDPEEAFPSEPQPESPLVAMARKVIGDAATATPGCGLEVTADDMEVWEVAEREGELAGMERRAKLERNRERRKRRLERMRYEELARNRNIQTAAQALVWEQERQADARAAEQAAVSAQAGRSSHESATKDRDAARARKRPQPEAAPDKQGAASAGA